jgi:hypothetical protein
MEELEMKKKLVALGMAAVMVVGGSVMAFGEVLDDAIGEAEIEFVLRLGNEVRPPDDDDLPPDLTPDQRAALSTMNLDFGVRDLLYMTELNNTFYTYDGSTGGDGDFGDAIADNLYDDDGLFIRYAVPAVANRTMGVTFESNLMGGFNVDVIRGGFVAANGTQVLNAATFSLLEYLPVHTVEGSPVTISGNPINLVLDNETRVASASTWGVSTASFSGRLSYVAREQIPPDSFQAVLTWVMTPPLT